MPLGAVKKFNNLDQKVFGNSSLLSKKVFGKWQNFPISMISHHGRMCCEIAREWFNAMDSSQLSGSSIFSGPRWIRQRYDWGPTKWKIHWCEVVRQKSLDCGAQAALAHEVFIMRGVECYQAQLVQQFSVEATMQWAERWRAEETSVFWINENLIYHECCAIVIDNGEIKLWDASSSCWINPKQFSGYGTLRALRLFAEPTKIAIFKWGEHVITANLWQEIKKDSVSAIVK